MSFMTLRVHAGAAMGAHKGCYGYTRGSLWVHLNGLI